MKGTRKNFVYWLILAALGVFLILGNRMAQDIMGKIFAVALLVAAASGIIAWLKDRSAAPDALFQLIGSVVVGAVGLWALLKTGEFITFLNVVLGLIILISSALSLYCGWKMGRDPLTMILAGLGMILGLVIACNNAATTWMTIAEGVGLIYTAITGFLGERSRARFRAG